MDDSGWKGVYESLKKDGYRVSVVQNPTPWGVDALGGLVTEPAWRSKPSWYLVAADDRMIPPSAQRDMSARAGSTVTEVEGSHAIHVSQRGSLDPAGSTPLPFGVESSS